MTTMLKLFKFDDTTAYYSLDYKRFRDSNKNIYKAKEVVLLVTNNGSKDDKVYVTLESYNSGNKDINKMTIVEEITPCQQKIDNLKISTRSGMFKLKCKSRKRNGTKHFTTGKNRGSAQVEKDQLDARYVKK